MTGATTAFERPHRARAVSPALVLLMLCTACSGVTGPEPQAVLVHLTATPTTATLGADITFHFDAQGNSLAGVALAYGDGRTDSIATFLARTAGATRTHAYTATGAYTARVSVLDSDGTQAADSLAITITAAAAPRVDTDVVATLPDARARAGRPARHASHVLNLYSPGSLGSR